MKLHDLQKEFMKMINSNAPTLTLPHEYIREGIEKLESGLSDSFPRLRGKARMGVRLKIYRDSSLGGRLKALSKVFNGTERMVGEQFFRQLTTEFLQKNVSQELTADAQGQQFPNFITNYTSAASLPYLSDLAQFEWLWYQVFHGAPNIPQFMQSNYPVTQLWEMCQPEYKGDFVLPDLVEPLRVMLVQREQRIHRYHLTEAEWKVLQQ